MENKDQILAEILFTRPSEKLSGNDLVNDYEVHNNLMQINLLKENFDIDYETGFFNDNVN
jgi:hypothetical protein